MPPWWNTRITNCEYTVSDLYKHASPTHLPLSWHLSLADACAQFFYVSLGSLDLQWTEDNELRQDVEIGVEWRTVLSHTVVKSYHVRTSHYCSWCSAVNWQKYKLNEDETSLIRTTLHVTSQQAVPALWKEKCSVSPTWAVLCSEAAFSKFRSSDGRSSFGADQVRNTKRMQLSQNHSRFQLSLPGFEV